MSIRRALPLLVASLLVLGACGDDGGGDGGATEAPEGTGGEAAGGTLTMWSTEAQQDRAAATREILSRFTEETGIETELVPVEEDALSETMVGAAASGDLPEVIFHPIDFTSGWAAQGLLDTETIAAVLDNLGSDTFSQGALDLVSVDGSPAAVPSDGWGQLLLYRTDLFEEAGLDAPTTYEAIEAAASALHGDDMNGMTAATTAGEVFTQQTYEQFALANDCQLTDGEAITLDSPQCAEALEFYTNLMGTYSPGTGQDVETTRSTYFAGQAAMIVWSPFILDELAGLRQDAVPTCPECQDDPQFLSDNTGIVPAFAGPSGSDAQYGQVSGFGIGAGSDTAAAQQFLEWFFDNGYLDWLALSPEGKLPLRYGTAEDPEAFTNGWRELETGVDERATLSSIYPDEVIDTLLIGTQEFDRWGFAQGQGELVSAMYSTLPVPDAIASVLSGETDVSGAVTAVQAAAEEEASLLE